MSIITSNKRIAKNTLMLYIRMLFSLCINLYTSRVLLRQLGVDDFGIYTLVGGIIALMGFLNSAMSGSSSRFLAYELGKDNPDNLRKTFSSSVQAHILIALVVLLLGETVGLWFINTQLVIPADRIVAANVVYQFALMTSIVSFFQVPYSADIIAREKMDVFAVIEICNVLLKLCVVFLLSAITYDKLILYPILLFVVALIIFFLYRFYCKKNFPEVVFSFTIEKNILWPMLKFSGWDLYGNGGVVAGQQGANILINRLFGLAVNAASGIANQASSAVIALVSNVTMSLRPPIIKLYASGDIRKMENLLSVAIVICLILAELVCVPLFLMIDPIMKLWLSDVPQYASEFCKWMIVANGISIINPLLNAVIHATGNIKRVSLITGTIYLMNILFVYIAFRFYDPVLIYKLASVISLSVIIVNLCIIKKQIQEISLLSIIRFIIRPICSLIVTVLLCVLISRFLNMSMLGFVIIFTVNLLTLFISFYIITVGPRYSWNISVIADKIKNMID